MRRPRPLKRTPSTDRDASLIVVASEDRYAVKQYFEEFFSSSRFVFRVLETADCRSSPDAVMTRLEEDMKEFEFGNGDQFWLVCDTDHWADPSHIKNLVDVLKRCKQKGIGTAISNPCFELWLLLHFADSPGSPVDKCDDVVALLKQSNGSYNKKRVYDLPVTEANVKQAIERAKLIHVPSQLIPDTPQTAVYQIIDALIANGQVKIRSQR